MADQALKPFRIGQWRVEPASGRIISESGEKTLRPKEMELFVYLAERQGEVVSADDIMSGVWAEVEVTNDSLYFSISQLRKQLDIPGLDQSLIETMPKRGYRLTTPVEWINDDREAVPASTNPGVTAITSRQAPGRRVAYFSALALLVVAAAGWLWREHPAVIAVDARHPPGSIAVMPLIDLSPETDYTYFSDGITDEILNRLARIRGLQVAARTSSFAFKDNEAGVAEIGKALGVGSILEGSVRKEGDRVRVSVQLIDTSSGFQLWSETYERELISIFAIQNDISRNIANALQLTLAPEFADSEAGELSASDPRVVDEYLLGLEASRSTSFDAYRRAQQHFESALKIDPAFTPALIQLADAKLAILNIGASYDVDMINQAESLVRRALQQDPDSGPAYRVLSMISKWRGEWQTAKQQAEKAIELAPSDSISMVALGEIHLINNDLEKAGQAFERALRIDPYGAAAMMKHAWVQERIGNIDEAHTTIKRAIDLHPENPNLSWRLGLIQVRELGDLVGGLDSFLHAAKLDPQDYEIAGYVAMTYLTLDMPDAARPWIDRALSDGAVTAVSQALVASFEQLSGDREQATAVATTAIRESNYRLLFHELLTENLIVIATTNLIKAQRIDDAIELLEENLPASTASLGPGKRLVLDGTIMPMNKFSDAWMTALASLYMERGDIERATTLFDAAANNRATVGLRETVPFSNDHFLMAARTAAMQGNSDQALEFIEEAVSRNFLFAWQIQVADDYALRSLHSEPRFQAIIDRLQTEVDRQRALVTSKTALSAVVDSKKEAARPDQHRMLGPPDEQPNYLPARVSGRLLTNN